SARVADHAGVVAARLLARIDVCTGPLLDVLVGQHQLLPGVERQRVLPRRLLAPGDETALDLAAAGQVVDRARGEQRRRPRAGRLAAVVERGDPRDQATAEVGRRIVEERGLGAVVLRLETRLEEVRPDAMTRRGREAEPDRSRVAL